MKAASVTLTVMMLWSHACADSAPAPTTATTTTSTTASTPTTTDPPEATTTAPVVTLPTTTTSAPGPAVRDDAFWRRLANCECESGQCDGPHVSYFQFSADTARKVGIDGSEPYEEQRTAAQEWARRIHPDEGTRSGWPVCWGVALRATG